jgi:hypothetical protein
MKWVGPGGKGEKGEGGARPVGRGVGRRAGWLGPASRPRSEECVGWLG